MRKREIITVRSAALADAPGIRSVHSQCDDPWADQAGCAVWINHRLLRGFLIDVAENSSTIIGHAEWIQSPDPAPYGEHLFLGMLQVHRDFQRRGVGARMIAAGERHAERLGCRIMRTCPTADAVDFYRRCGFDHALTTGSCRVPVSETKLPHDWCFVRTVPRKVVVSLPMRIGWYQGSSAHMWEIANRWPPVFGERMYHPAARSRAGDAYIQIRAWEDHDTGFAIAWADPKVSMSELVSPLMALSRRLGKSHLSLCPEAQAREAISALPNAVAEDEVQVWSKRVNASSLRVSHDS